MPYLLFPGRHHLLTTFQLQYLTRVVSGDPADLRDVDGQPLAWEGRFDTILWAITSANHANTRRNPLPAHRREVAIEEFGRDLDADSFTFLIDDIGFNSHFASYVLEKIVVDSLGRFRPTPANTVVACSTPEVISQYEQLGFRILPVELIDRETHTWSPDPPWKLLDYLVAVGLAGRDWRTDARFLGEASRASRRLYLKYRYGDRIIDLHRHPVLTADGDLTATRDYNVYVRAFDEGAERKYALIQDHVVPGRIVDIGCCTGSLLQQMAKDDRLRESDFYGIELARRLYVECLHRKEQGAFAVDNVFFYQYDMAESPLFPNDSVNTFTTFSLTHELESYQGRAVLERFLGLLHQQLALGGRWLNVDVVGPENKEQLVYLWLNHEDGRNDDWERPLDGAERLQSRDYLGGLSTFTRFLRFARDFRASEGSTLNYQRESVADQDYIVLSLRDACEFLSKKDYLDNWQSEMHETFCFWSFPEWCQAVEPAGFRVRSPSHAFTNPWIVQNRYEGKAALYQKEGDRLVRLPWPVTNMLLVAEKR